MFAYWSNSSNFPDQITGFKKCETSSTSLQNNHNHKDVSNKKNAKRIMLQLYLFHIEEKNIGAGLFIGRSTFKYNF